MAARLLGAGDLPDRGRCQLPGTYPTHPRLLHQRHCRYRRARPLRHRRRLGAHHPAHTLRQRDKEPNPLHHHTPRHHHERRRPHHRLQLRDEHDDRLRLLPAEAGTRLRRFRRYDIPPLPLLRRLVPQATQANQHTHRQGQAEPRPQHQQRRPHRPEPTAGQPHLLRHIHPRQREPALQAQVQAPHRRARRGHDRGRRHRNEPGAGDN